jgi:hypothetical protein
MLKAKEKAKRKSKKKKQKEKAKRKSKKQKQNKQKNNIWNSNVVPRQSTNQARLCLTSLSRREAVLLSWYGHSPLLHKIVSICTFNYIISRRFFSKGLRAHSVLKKNFLLHSHAFSCIGAIEHIKKNKIRILLHSKLSFSAQGL